MGISKELSDSIGRFKIYIDRLIALLEKHEVRNVSTLIQAVRTNDAFREDWRAIWSNIAKADGGKISLTTAGAILGAVLGGVGIAAMGGAIGLPLALILGLGGLIAGAEFDSARALSRTKFQLLRVPKPIYARVEAAAKSAGVSVNEILVRTLSAAFPDPSELASGQ
jgi:hypothetical protein